MILRIEIVIFFLNDMKRGRRRGWVLQKRLLLIF
jgi:hypothetical protein